MSSWLRSDVWNKSNNVDGGNDTRHTKISTSSVAKNADHPIVKKEASYSHQNHSVNVIKEIDANKKVGFAEEKSTKKDISNSNKNVNIIVESMFYALKSPSSTPTSSSISSLSSSTSSYSFSLWLLSETVSSATPSPCPLSSSISSSDVVFEESPKELKEVDWKEKKEVPSSLVE